MSTGSPGTVQCTQAVRDALLGASGHSDGGLTPGGVDVELRGRVDIKGKGVMHTFWLSQQRDTAEADIVGPLTVLAATGLVDETSQDPAAVVTAPHAPPPRLSYSDHALIVPALVVSRRGAAAHREDASLSNASFLPHTAVLLGARRSSETHTSHSAPRATAAVQGAVVSERPGTAPSGPTRISSLYQRRTRTTGVHESRDSCDDGSLLFAPPQYKALASAKSSTIARDHLELTGATGMTLMQLAWKRDAAHLGEFARRQRVHPIDRRRLAHALATRLDAAEKCSCDASARTGAASAEPDLIATPIQLPIISRHEADVAEAQLVASASIPMLPLPLTTVPRGRFDPQDGAVLTSERALPLSATSSTRLNPSHFSMRTIPLSVNARVAALPLSTLVDIRRRASVSWRARRGDVNQSDDDASRDVSPPAALLGASVQEMIQRGRSLVSSSSSSFQQLRQKGLNRPRTQSDVAGMNLSAAHCAPSMISNAQTALSGASSATSQSALAPPRMNVDAPDKFARSCTCIKKRSAAVSLEEEALGSDLFIRQVRGVTLVTHSYSTLMCTRTHRHVLSHATHKCTQKIIRHLYADSFCCGMVWCTLCCDADPWSRIRTL
jgi:hypothetical protein